MVKNPFENRVCLVLVAERFIIIPYAYLHVCGFLVIGDFLVVPSHDQQFRKSDFQQRQLRMVIYELILY